MRILGFIFVLLVAICPAMSQQIVVQSSSSQAIVFFMSDAADHITGKTGLSPTVTISKNGGSFASPSGSVSEVANGWYKLAGNATDSNTVGPLTLHATATGADPADLKLFVTDNISQTGDSYARIGSNGSGLTSVGVATNNDKTGYSLSGAQSITSLAISGAFSAGSSSFGAGTFVSLNPGTTTFQSLALTNASNLSALSVGTIDNVQIDPVGVTTLLIRLTAPRAGNLDNISAAAPSAASIATQVWQDLTSGSDFSTSSSIGLLLKNDVDAAISSRGTSTLTQPQVTGGNYALQTDSSGYSKLSVGNGTGQASLSSGRFTVGGGTFDSGGTVAVVGNAQQINSGTPTISGGGFTMTGVNISGSGTFNPAYLGAGSFNPGVINATGIVDAGTFALAGFKNSGSFNNAGQVNSGSMTMAGIVNSGSLSTGSLTVSGGISAATFNTSGAATFAGGVTTNLNGSIGSIAANGISSNSFATNSITAAAVASDAATEIANAMLDQTDGVDTGVTPRQLMAAWLAMINGKASVVDNGNGTETWTFKKRDGSTTSFTVIKTQSTGARTATGSGPN